MAERMSSLGICVRGMQDQSGQTINQEAVQLAGSQIAVQLPFIPCLRVS